MLTIINAVELSAEYLSKKNVESPRINAEVLLANILHCRRMDLYLKFDQPLTEEEIDHYRNFIRRRGEREPLQYITGNVEFYGKEFFVDENVLIPRQETEILVEEIIKREDKDRCLSILDIGTGSGNIAISLCNNLPLSKISSIDKSEKAIEVAIKNAKKNKTNGRIIFSVVDLRNYEESIKFDIIVSNPPYISLHDYSTLEPEIVNFEPKSALTDGDDGLIFYKVISKKAKELLIQKGKLYFEIGQGQASPVIEIMKTNGFSNIEVVRDYQNIDRVIIGEFE